MKAKLEKPIRTETEEKTPGTRGRQPVNLRFPKWKRGFTVAEAVEFNKKANVSPLTVRNRLNAMTNAEPAEATARLGKMEGRGHPPIIYTLVA